MKPPSPLLPLPLKSGRGRLLYNLLSRKQSANTAVGVSGKEINPLEYWRKELRWPNGYIEPESGFHGELVSRLHYLSSDNPYFDIFSG
jgi:hypothetical protein